MKTFKYKPNRIGSAIFRRELLVVAAGSCELASWWSRTEAGKPDRPDDSGRRSAWSGCRLEWKIRIFCSVNVTIETKVPLISWPCVSPKMVIVSFLTHSQDFHKPEEKFWQKIWHPNSICLRFLSGVMQDLNLKSRDHNSNKKWIYSFLVFSSYILIQLI